MASFAQAGTEASLLVPGCGLGICPVPQQERSVVIINEDKMKFFNAMFLVTQIY